MLEQVVMLSLGSFEQHLYGCSPPVGVWSLLGAAKLEGRLGDNEIQRRSSRQERQSHPSMCSQRHFADFLPSTDSLCSLANEPHKESLPASPFLLRLGKRIVALCHARQLLKTGCGAAKMVRITMIELSLLPFLVTPLL